MTVYYANPLGNDGNNGLSAGAAKTLQGAFAAAAANDTIILAGSTSAPIEYTLGHNYYLPGGKKLLVKCEAGKVMPLTDPLGDGAPYAPFAKYGAVIVGYLTVPLSCDIEFQEISFTEKSWPGAGQIWDDLGTAAYPTTGLSGASIFGATGGGYGPKLRLTRCEIWKGYGSGQALYDSSYKYPEMNSPNPWYFADGKGRITGTNPGGGTPQQGWGDATWSNYNTIATGPQAFGGRFSQLLLTDCWIHDIMRGVVANIEQNTDYLADGCVFQRCYNDFETIATEGNSWSSLKTRNCLFLDAFGDGRDSGNPHTDVKQIWGTKAGSTPNPLINVEFNNSAYLMSPTCRGQPQGLFLETFTTNSAPQVLVGPKIRNVVGLGLQKGFASNSVYDAYIRNCIFANPDWFRPGGQVPYTASIGGSAFGGLNGAQLDQTTGLLANTVYEQRAGTVDYTRRNCADLGNPAARALALANVFSSPTTQGATPEALYQAFKTKGVYSGMGPPHATLRAMLTDRASFTGEMVFCGLRAVRGVNVSPAVVTSQPAVIHGGEPGDLLPISVSAGLQWRTLDVDRTTQLTAWTAASGNVPVGKYLQVQRTAPATAVTTVTGTVTLGGEVIPWEVTTKSSNDWPKATKPNTNYLVRTPGGALTVSDSGKFIFACNINLPAVFASSPEFAASTSGRGLRTGIITAGAGYKIAFEWGNTASGAIVCNHYTPQLTFGKEYLIQISVDLSKPSAAEGQLLSCIDVATGLEAGAWYNDSWASGATVGFSFPFYSFAANAGNGVRILKTGAATIGFIYLNCTECLTALSNNFTPDNIGVAGDGITGRVPEIFIVGETVPNNRGGSGAWQLDSGAMTAANAATWPPPLALTATLQTAGPFRINQPIDILIAPVGRNKALNATLASDKAGAWAAATKALAAGSNGVVFTFTPTATGAHTLSVSNDGGYGNPTALALTVVADYVAIPAGSTVILTKAQALTLEAVTSADTVGAARGTARVEWQRSAAEGPPTDAIAFTFDVS